MRCEICKKNIEELFLKKIKGTFIRDEKGKRHAVCFECQKNLKTRENILKEI